MKVRSRFRADLVEILDEAADLAGVVADDLRAACAALRTGDADVVVPVIGHVDAVAARCQALEDRCVDLIAREQPVAGDLRLIVAGIGLGRWLGRSERLVEHLAHIAAQFRPPEPPSPVVEAITALAEETTSIYDFAVAAFRSQDRDFAGAIEPADDRVDAAAATLRDVAHHGYAGIRDDADVRQIMDVALIVRYLERLGDHAANIAEHALYIIGPTAGEAATPP